MPHGIAPRASLVATLLVPLVLAQAPDPDRDGDGLSDFHELHKYRTDPARADSDGDGVPDGDWRERREYQYTVRSVVQVMRPVTPEFLCDDYQDARVLDETERYVELEVWHYPFNGVADAIGADPSWRRAAARMKEWTAAGPTNDWTSAMRRDLIAALHDDDIDVAKLDDRALVEQVSSWLCRRAVPHDGFTAFVTGFDEQGRPYVPDELRAGAERAAQAAGWTIDEQWRRELSARGMFEEGTHGSCSSTSIYLNGCLRALGVPARTVLCIPLIDAGDEREWKLLERGIRHHVLRRELTTALERLRGSWSSHTFNEVFVGGRWRRLNYGRLGQDIRDPGLFGLMTHVATFSDWADADMPATIGRRQKGERADDVFGGNNPYSTIALRDEFGVHCTLDNPAAAVPEMRIERLSWCDDGALPVDVRDWFGSRGVFGLVAVLEGADSGTLADFLRDADPQLELRAEGRPPLALTLDEGCWWTKADGRSYVAVRFAGGSQEQLAEGVSYAVVARNESAAGRWELADRASRLRRE